MTQAHNGAPPYTNATLYASTSSAAAGENPRVVQALEEYRAAQENHEHPSRQQLLERYADVARELAACLDVLDFVRTAAPKLGGHELGGRSLPSVRVDSTGDSTTDTILGDYRILREVGRGGMGVVYEAQQLSLRRRVALKVLPFAAVLDARQLTRFQNEAQAAAALHHTNIVPVFSVGHERGVHFYAMQFIAGRSLAQAVDEMKRAAGISSAGYLAKTVDLASPERSPAILPLPPGEGRFEGVHVPCPHASAVLPLPPGEGWGEGVRVSRLSADTAVAKCSQSTLDETPRSDSALSGLPPRKSPEFFRAVARLGVQAAEALQHAHDAGIVHRDIKPANLMLDMAGNLWITDFGLARLETDAGLTMTGDLLGTLKYMSPEQVAGQPTQVDHRTDVYSLGATLYELLCLRAVVEGANREQLLRKVVDADPTPPRRFNSAIPADLETIVLKALQKRSADRYATAQELADDLRRFLGDTPIHAKRPSLVMRARKWARRHRQVVATTACCAILSLAVAGVWMALSYRERAAIAAREEIKRQADIRYGAHLAALKQAIHFMFRQNTSLAEHAFQDAFTSLAKLREEFPANEEYRLQDLAAKFFYHHFLVQCKRHEEANQALEMLVADFGGVNFDESGDWSTGTLQQMGKCYFHLGQSLVLRGDDTQAATFFARARQCLVHCCAPNGQDAQARCLIEWGMCLDRQQKWEQARRKYWQALPLLEDWYTTMETLPRAGAWLWTSYPHMCGYEFAYERGLPKQVLQMNEICLLQLAIVYQRLQLNSIARDVFQSDIHFSFELGPPHEAVAPLLVEAATLLPDIPEYMTLEDAPNVVATFTPTLAKHSVELLTRAEATQRRGDVDGAYAHFEAAIRHAEQANLDLRRNALLRQLAEQLGPRGANRFAVYAAEREKLDQPLTAASQLDVLPADPASIGDCRVQDRIATAAALGLSHAGKPAEARAALQRCIVAYRKLNKLVPENSQFQDMLANGLSDFGTPEESRAATEPQLALLRKKAAVESDDYHDYTHLAWFLAATKFSDLRDPVEALRLIEKAQAMKAESKSALRAEVAAYYRLGRWSDADRSAEKALAIYQKERLVPLAELLYFHAMVKWQLGEHARAREIYDQAARTTQTAKYSQVQSIREEADALLGIAPPAAEVSSPTPSSTAAPEP